jgi:hypothetical protein
VNPESMPPRDLVAGAIAPPARAPNQPEPSDPRSAVEIRSSVPLQPEPLDPHPTAQIRKYPFGMEALLKSP